MEVIIAGSRHLRVSVDFLKHIFNFFEIPKNKVSLIRHGDADGVDTCGRLFAEAVGLPHQAHPYKSELGKAGGPIRNQEMADAVLKSESGGCLVLIWDGNSRGSANMKFEARKRGLPVFEIVLHNPTQEERKQLGIYKPPHARKSQVLKSNQHMNLGAMV